MDDWEADSQHILHLSVNTAFDAMLRRRAYQRSGFEIGLHLNTGCANYTRDSLAALFHAATAISSKPRIRVCLLRRRIASTASPGVATPPCRKWSYLFGIRLDTNYYYWPPAWVADRPGLFTGSGMPMRFATTNGNVIDVYQAATQMTDESGQSYPYTIDTLLDRALGPEGYYGAFVANMHTDCKLPSRGSDAIVYVGHGPGGAGYLRSPTADLAGRAQ